MGNFDYKPNWASSPGDTIKDILIERGLSWAWLAEQTKTSQMYIDKLLRGEIAVTGEMASRLGELLGPNAEFWIDRDMQYQEALKRLQKENGGELK